MRLSAHWPLLLLVLSMGSSVSAQETPPPSSSSSSSSSDNSANASGEREVSWKLLAPNILDDQKHIWLFPAHIAKKKNWLPALAVVGVTAGLVAADPYPARYFRSTTSFHTFNNIFSGNSTTGMIIAVPSVLYLYGLKEKSSYAQHTALLAAEDVVDAEIPNIVLRTSIHRLRPADIPPNGNAYDTWFETNANPVNAKGSFPSGHAASAFAVATVFSMRYSKQHRWVPWVAYGGAALIGFSRVSTNAHFLSDVFFGSALGFSVSRFAVLRQ